MGLFDNVKVEKTNDPNCPIKVSDTQKVGNNEVKTTVCAAGNEVKSVTTTQVESRTTIERHASNVMGRAAPQSTSNTVTTNDQIVAALFGKDDLLKELSKNKITMTSDEHETNGKEFASLPRPGQKPTVVAQR